MIDPKYIREHAKEVKANCKKRLVSADVDAWLELDAQRLALIQETESLRAKRNAIAEQMKTAAKDEREPLIETGKSLKDEIAVKEAKLKEVEASWQVESMKIPNLTHPDAPEGKSDEDNKEVRKVGKVHKVKSALDHVELGK